MNRYLALIMAVIYGAELQAQTLQPAPRLVVNIAIDQLRTDYIEYFAPKYSDEGLRRLLENGTVYQAASYPFTPVDRASAIASIATGTTPYYHGIIGTRWLDRNTLRPVFCVDDPKHCQQQGSRHFVSRSCCQRCHLVRQHQKRLAKLNLLHRSRGGMVQLLQEDNRQQH